MSKRRFALIFCFLLCLFSCCGKQSIIELPSEFASKSNVRVIKILIDEEFTITEDIAIYNALDNWTKVSNEYIKFNYSHHTKPGRLESYFWTRQYGNSIFIWRADSKNISDRFDHKFIGFAGFWDLHGNIVIFADRIDKEDNQLYRVMLHESGHMLGLKHIVYEKSVMQPRAVDISDCITKDDTDRLCLIYGCQSNPECD